ncbi:NO-inducible flavohemoprotein [Paenibacillus sp. J5C_2022]|uniref:NO-inducible flavohemoprotein n=1 Tax=Paenibacillus sp. J5C2022 TaxID=2977129 RepID=UPI0021D164CC|nr:NO-inducible flavohemoprotein [Paenibacillus sp. J5C2022]MCU6710850.1 NO-inducible flavohemoprotein [Paenibacillus sp. J5C2022]
MSLSPQTIAIIKSTVPVLKVRGTEITKCFYSRMFARHPELLNIFNHAHQKQGRQQGALANAVYAAAAHIDNLEAILPAVMQIAHKHRSLGVKPEHYPIVGRHLLEAIKEVLGDAATDEVLQAWGEAYGIIADAFIGVENALYEEAEAGQGGWEGFRPFIVERKVVESDVIASFYLVPQDGGALAAFRPGQYISVKMDIPGLEHTHIRQYSLSAAPGMPYYRISVKREEENRGRPAGIVSSYLHEMVREGDIVHLSAPAGEFVLEQPAAAKSKQPIVLISGGVGQTPLLSMLHALMAEQPQRPVVYIHAAQNGDVHALRDEVLELARRHEQLSCYFCYERPTDRDRSAGSYHKEGYMELTWLKSILPASAASSYYFCGPVPFMEAVHDHLKELGVEDAAIHYEFFGPSATLNRPSAASLG